LLPSVALYRRRCPAQRGGPCRLRSWSSPRDWLPSPHYGTINCTRLGRCECPGVSPALLRMSVLKTQLEGRVARLRDEVRYLRDAGAQRNDASAALQVAKLEASSGVRTRCDVERCQFCSAPDDASTRPSACISSRTDPTAPLSRTLRAHLRLRQRGQFHTGVSRGCVLAWVRGWVFRVQCTAPQRSAAQRSAAQRSAVQRSACVQCARRKQAARLTNRSTTGRSCMRGQPRRSPMRPLPRRTQHSLPNRRMTPAIAWAEKWSGSAPALKGTEYSA
jgi:hypothetical protein